MCLYIDEECNEILTVSDLNFVAKVQCHGFHDSSFSKCSHCVKVVTSRGYDIMYIVHKKPPRPCGIPEPWTYVEWRDTDVRITCSLLISIYQPNNINSIRFFFSVQILSTMRLMSLNQCGRNYRWLHCFTGGSCSLLLSND